MDPSTASWDDTSYTYTYTGSVCSTCGAELHDVSLDQPHPCCCCCPHSGHVPQPAPCVAPTVPAEPAAAPAAAVSNSDCADHLPSGLLLLRPPPGYGGPFVGPVASGGLPETAARDAACQAEIPAVVSVSIALQTDAAEAPRPTVADVLHGEPGGLDGQPGVDPFLEALLLGVPEPAAAEGVPADTEPGPPSTVEAGVMTDRPATTDVGVAAVPAEAADAGVQAVPSLADASVEVDAGPDVSCAVDVAVLAEERCRGLIRSLAEETAAAAVAHELALGQALGAAAELHAWTAALWSLVSEEADARRSCCDTEAGDRSSLTASAMQSAATAASVAHAAAVEASREVAALRERCRELEADVEGEHIAAATARDLARRAKLAFRERLVEPVVPAPRNPAAGPRARGLTVSELFAKAHVDAVRDVDTELRARPL